MNNKIVKKSALQWQKPNVVEISEIYRVLFLDRGLVEFEFNLPGGTSRWYDAIDLTYNSYLVYNNREYRTMEDFKTLQSVIEYHKTIKAIENL